MTNKIAMNIYTQVFVWMYAFTHLDKFLGIN